VTRRLRIAHLIVQPVLVWDDGNDLAPGPDAAPIKVALSALPDMPARLLAEAAQVEDPEASGGTAV
jgi:hypothetical protein